MMRVLAALALLAVPVLAFAQPGFLSLGSSGEFTAADPDADFLARRSGAGVVRWFGFEPSELAINGGPIQTTNFETNAGLSNQGLDPLANEFASDQKASGTTSLKFYIRGFTGAGAEGSFMTNFSTDYSVRFEEGDEFYVQWRQRMTPAFLTNEYRENDLDPTNWKQAIITSGDTETVNKSSCQDLEIVPGNNSMRGFPQIYHACGGAPAGGGPLYTSLPGFDYDLQPNRICNYLTAAPYTWPPSDADCFPYYADEWMTFEVRVKIGTWYQNDGNRQYDSTVQMWGARECQPPELIIDRSPESSNGTDLLNVGSDEFYGAVWLTPYMTGKGDLNDYPEAHTWYDELIISTAEIPFPCQDGAALPTTQ